MRSALSVAIAALLVTSLLTMAIVAADPTAETPPVEDHSSTLQPALQPDGDETTARLGLAGPTETAYTTQSPDLGTTLAATDDQMRNEWLIHEAAYRWQDLSDAEREELLDELEDRLIDRIDELDAREQRAVADVVEGDVSADHLLRTMARNDHEATVLITNINRLSSYADDVPDYRIVPRTPTNMLQVYQGPVRSNAYETISAADRSDRPGVTTIRVAESGAVVSAIEGGTYLREAVRFDNRDPSLPNQLEDRTAASDRISEHYPLVHDAGFSSDPYLLESHYSIQLFRLDTDHEHGALNAYLDGGTTEIFRENQELNLNDLPRVALGTWEDGDLNVTVNGTPGDELVEVTVTDAESGEPLDATIQLDDQPVIETDDAGVAWLAPPPTEYELTVQTDAGSTTIDDLG